MSTPSAFLQNLLGRPVVVKLNSGVDYRGVLACLDGYMNIALEQVNVGHLDFDEHTARRLIGSWILESAA